MGVRLSNLELDVIRTLHHRQRAFTSRQMEKKRNTGISRQHLNMSSLSVYHLLCQSVHEPTILAIILSSDGRMPCNIMPDNLPLRGVAVLPRGRDKKLLFIFIFKIYIVIFIFEI